jgi:heme oxygenase
MLSIQLKEQTKENHQILEKKLIQKMRAMHNKKNYLDLLTIFYSYFGGLEKLINNHLIISKVPDYAIRRKADQLTDDIASLGGQLPAVAATQFLPKITSHEEALGALYVMEGSTLGGKIISQMISKQLGLDEALSFFKSYGENTMMMWERFQLVLNQSENFPGLAIISSANDTFGKFSEWFDLNA